MDEEQIKMLQELHNKKTDDRFKDPDGNMGDSGTLRERLDSISNSADVDKADEWWKKIQHGPAFKGDDPIIPPNMDDNKKRDRWKDIMHLKQLKPVEGVGGWKGKPVPGMIKGTYK